MDAPNAYPYFGEEMLLTQFSLLAESIQKALPPDSQGQEAIAQQILRINSKKEKWPSRILSLYRNRTLPVFSMEGVTKLNQAHDAFITDVNDTRRRQKDSLKSDMNRKKKQLDDMKTKKERYIDSYESIVLAARNEQSLHGPNTFEFAQFNSKIISAEFATFSGVTDPAFLLEPFLTPAACPSPRTFPLAAAFFSFIFCLTSFMVST